MFFSIVSLKGLLRSEPEIQPNGHLGEDDVFHSDPFWIKHTLVHRKQIWNDLFSGHGIIHSLLFVLLRCHGPMDLCGQEREQKRFIR